MNQNTERKGKEEGSILSLSEKVRVGWAAREIRVEVDKFEKCQTQEKGEHIGSFPVTEPETGVSLGRRGNERCQRAVKSKNGKAGGWSDDTAMFRRRG